MKMSDETKVSLVTAACILALAVISKNVLGVQIDTLTLYGPVWVYIAYVISKDAKPRIGYSPLAWSTAILLVTLATLVLYAV